MQTIIYGGVEYKLVSDVYYARGKIIGITPFNILIGKFGNVVYQSEPDICIRIDIDTKRSVVGGRVMDGIPDTYKKHWILGNKATEEETKQFLDEINGI